MTVQTDYVNLTANCGEPEEIEEVLKEIREYLETKFTGREISISIQSILTPGDMGMPP